MHLTTEMYRKYFPPNMPCIPMIVEKMDETSEIAERIQKLANCPEIYVLTVAIKSPKTKETLDQEVPLFKRIKESIESCGKALQKGLVIDGLQCVLTSFIVEVDFQSRHNSRLGLSLDRSRRIIAAFTSVWPHSKPGVMLCCRS